MSKRHDLEGKVENFTVGFIGQGYVGGSYADDFERRGYRVVRYSLDHDHIKNGNVIGECDVVFIAVPTPTTTRGFDGSVVASVLPLVGSRKLAVIKSTVIPGTTEKLQEKFPKIYVIHSPEFLSKATAATEASCPKRTIIGIPHDNKEYRKKAALLLSILPKAPFELVCGAREAEFIKYTSNCFSYTKVVFMNILYDIACALNLNWDCIQEAMGADPWIGGGHLNPVHKGGRGAGGVCLLKDFDAFVKFYRQILGDKLGEKVLKSIRLKNFDLLLSSKKDVDIIESLFGRTLHGLVASKSGRLGRKRRLIRRKQKSKA